MEKIKINQFFDQFKVKRNPIESYSPFENRLLDMNEDELDYLEGLDSHNIWTLIDKENIMELIPGCHSHDVMGYFICEKKWENANEKFYLQ